MQQSLYRLCSTLKLQQEISDNTAVAEREKAKVAVIASPCSTPSPRLGEQQ